VATVRQWSGREARALRRALRLSVRAYADHLGVAARTVAKWEAQGAATCPRPDTQAILDTALNRADSAVQVRFELLLRESDGTPVSAVSLGSPRTWDYETWAEDLERAVVNLSQQNFHVAGSLLNRWLTRFELGSLDSKGLYLHGRSLVLLADLQRDQGAVAGTTSAAQTYRRALRIFEGLDIPRRAAQVELSLAVVAEMAGGLETAARRYQLLSKDERLSRRDRARAQLWVGTALSKEGKHAYAAQVMLPATSEFEALEEPHDWSVAHQKLALAYRGVGDLERALSHIDIALKNGTTNAPMQRVRITTAHAHILLSDKATWDNGLAMLDSATDIAGQFGLAHQLASMQNIRQSFEYAAGRKNRN
jgi:transcriptional regulator with XRE-family HTH domain